MIDINELRDRAATFGSDYLTDEEWVEVIDRLEAAEKSDAESIAMYRKARDERDALRAKVEQMEKQEPVELRFPSALRKMWASYEIQQWIEEQGPLYALPGAQPAQSVPDEIERDVLRACCGTFHGSRHRITCERYKGKKAPEAKP